MTPGFAPSFRSYQIATTKELHPRVAILLNITDDHLAWHRTHENYAEAKIRLFQNMDECDLAIVDVEDEGNMAHRDEIFKPGRRVLSLSCEDSGADDAAFVRDGRMVVRLAGVENELVSTADLKIAGHHNVINALAAAAAALACGASAASVRGGACELCAARASYRARRLYRGRSLLQRFKGNQHRRSRKGPHGIPSRPR